LIEVVEFLQQLVAKLVSVYKAFDWQGGEVEVSKFNYIE